MVITRVVPVVPHQNNNMTIHSSLLTTSWRPKEALQVYGFAELYDTETTYRIGSGEAAD